MSMNAAVFSTFFFTALIYFGLLAYILRLDEPLGAERWMAVVVLWSVAVAAALAVNSAGVAVGLGPGMWVALFTLAGICLLGAVTFSYLEIGGPIIRRLKFNWPLLWAATIAPLSALIYWADTRDTAPGLIEFTWRAALIQRGAWFPWAAAALWALIGFVLIAITLNTITRTTLPLHANRRLWWVITLIMILLGEALALWGVGAPSTIGQIVRAAGVAAGVYVTTTQELVDVRGMGRAIIGNAFFVGVMALIIVLGISLSLLLINRLPGIQGWLAAVAVAVVIALIYQRMRPGINKLVQKAVLAAGYDSAQVSAAYSQRATDMLEIDQLAITVGITLAGSVQASRSALLLLTPAQNVTRVQVLIGVGRMPTTAHEFEGDGLFLRTLAATRRPLLQYTLDTKPDFRALPAADREWLRKLGMDVYAPIFDGATLGGVMAVGSRLSGDPYRKRDLDLLSTIADQTSVALKNARLVANLRILNEQMRALNEEAVVLNKNLAASNERLKQLDQVKTDFISIASHELRTPLTKIRGYTDVLDSMNSNDGVDQGQIALVAGHLLKACDRLEEVVSQLLDVSQLDVEALDLHFIETSIDTVLELALEPWYAVIAERKQRLEIQGAENLPPMQGDFQRLVQAFSQVIGNAVKYTPDGGSIRLYANHLPANAQIDRPDAIEVVVADTGVGIDPEHQDLIFEKFYRVGDPTLHSTGTSKFMGAGPGLGLTIARGIINRHNGQLWVESPGFDDKTFPGSQFHIVLPVKPLPVNKPARLHTPPFIAV